MPERTAGPSGEHNDTPNDKARPARQSASPTKALMSSPVQPDGPGAEPFATLRNKLGQNHHPCMRGAESGKTGQGTPLEGGCSFRNDSTVEGTKGARPR